MNAGYFESGLQLQLDSRMAKSQVVEKSRRLEGGSSRLGEETTMFGVL